LLPHRSLGDDGRLATRFEGYGNDGPDRLDGDHDPNRPECVALTDMFGF
jgi:hypothetical protein